MAATIIQSGNFVSTGKATTINLRSDVDWMEVINFTQISTTQTPGRGVKFEWFRGMVANIGIMFVKSDGANTLNGTLTNQFADAFKLIDTSNQTPGPLNSTITAISAAAIPIVTTSAPHLLSAGDRIRILDVVSAQQLGGMDFTVGEDTLTATTFSLDFMDSIAAATTGNFRKLFFQPQFYPRRRLITKILLAPTIEITMSVTHEFTVGQAVRFIVPPDFGTVELDGLIGTIIELKAQVGAPNTIVVNIDGTFFTPFAFPLSAGVPFTNAQVVPVGEGATEPFANLLDDATENRSVIGMQLGAGPLLPAGSDEDIIFWKAGKSTLVDNDGILTLV